MTAQRTIYRLLLHLYPARFREEYETPLERQFWDEYREIEGKPARALFWLRALADLGMSIPAEIARELRQDLRYTAKVYRRRAFPAALALTALALAIGAATGVFSVVNALLLRSLPFREPERLVQLLNFQGVPGAEFHAWSKSTSFLEDAAVYRTEMMNVGTSAAATRVTVAETSANFFQLLGSEPQIGRAFAPGEDVEGHNSLAIIGYGLWQNFFGGDPRVLGSTIRVNGSPLTVVGIAPPGLDYPGKTAVWTPTIFDLFHLSQDRGRWWNAAGRLKPGIALTQASRLYRAAIVAAIPRRVTPAQANKYRLTSLRNVLAGNVAKASWVLLGVVIFVLLTACANVAQLLLSRITERRPEMALRAALGASRARLVQQLITESTLLTAIAAVAGLGVAVWTSRLAAIIQPAPLSAQEYTVLDWPVLGFAAALALLTGLIFGVLPASLIGRMQPSMDTLRSQPGVQDRGVRRARSLLVAMQAAFTLVLLSGAVTMSRSFLKLVGTDLGLQTAHVVTMQVALAGSPRENAGAAYIQEALERLRGIPGVEWAGAVESLPLSDYSIAGFPNFKIGNEPAGHPGSFVTATPGYLPAIGTEILRGRDFTDAEQRGSKAVAIVNEAFARQFDPRLEVVGQRLIAPFGSIKEMTIVGVARTQRYGGPGDEGMPLVFLLNGWSSYRNMTLVARVHGNTKAYLPICRDVLRSLDPKTPVFDVRTFEQRLDDSLAKPRFYTTAVLFLGCFALLLAIAGIYGVTSFSIAQRAHEIGVRLAVGASPERLRAMLLGESLLPVAAGMGAGLAASLGFGRLLQHLMEATEPIGFPACAGAAVVLSLTAAAAIRTATRRIVQLDPARVLRTD